MLCCTLLQAREERLSVVFLNPGFSDERFWNDYSRYMQDAAADLDIDLRVLYGERDNQRVLSNVRQVLDGKPPDYLLFTNEQFFGPNILRLFAHTDVRLLALHSTLTAEQQKLIGGSRERYANWIGSLVPNDEEAGYLMGRELIALSQGQPTQMLAFAGVKQTPSSTLRQAGLQRALSEAPHVRLLQAVYGEWQAQRAYQQAMGLLPRHPGAELVWTANDAMAQGVMQAASELGRDLRYGTLNNSPQILQARAEERVEVLLSGHFLLGACSLVMIADHAGGLDFAERGGKDQVARLLRVVDAQAAQKLLMRLAREDIGVDFRQFSALGRAEGQVPACSIEPLLE